MRPLTVPILRQLSDNEFRSGATIAKALGISRASVSCALRGLDDLGLTVHKVHGRGYRLAEPLQWLDRDVILKHMGVDADSFKLDVVDKIDSTSNFLLKIAAGGADSSNGGVHVVAAELQTAGRGRRGRIWHSGLGDGLAFSLLWRFERGAGLLSGLSLAIGVAIVRSLDSYGIKGTVLKWPNDVMYNMCKLAGILIELHGDMFGPTMAVIGVGMNLKLSNNIHACIDQGATDMYSISGEMPDRNELLAAVVTGIAGVLRDFERKGFAPFKREWIARHVCENKVVKLRFPDGSSQEGVANGVADDGSLLVRTSAGLQSYHSGEITLSMME